MALFHLQPHPNGDALHRSLTKLGTVDVWLALVCAPASITYSTVELLHRADWWPLVLVNVGGAVALPGAFYVLNLRRLKREPLKSQLPGGN